MRESDTLSVIKQRRKSKEGKEKKGEEKKGKERKKGERGGWPAMAGDRRWPAAIGAAQTQGKRRGAILVHFDFLEFLKRHFRERRIGSLERARRGGEDDIIGGG